MGTPGYMSPEQIKGDQASSASDVFSAGLVVYYALTGEEPFGRGAAAAVLYRIVHESFDVNQLRVSEDLRRWIEFASAKDPAARPDAWTLARGLDPRSVVDAPPSVAPPQQPVTPAPPPQQPVTPAPPSVAPPPVTSSRSSQTVLVAVLVGVFAAIVIGLAVVLALRGPGLSGATTTTTQPVAYTSPQGFAVKLPPRWKGRYEKADQTDRFTGPDGQSSAFVGKIGPSLSSLQKTDPEALINEYVKKQVQLEGRFQYPDEIVTVDKDVTYGEYPGVGFEFEVVDSSSRSRYTAEMFVFNTKDSIWAVLNIAPKGGFESTRGDFNEFEQSFAVK